MEYAGALQSSHTVTSTARLPAIVLIVIGVASLFLPAFAGISISVVVGIGITLAGLACGSLTLAAFRTRTFLWRLLVAVTFTLVGIDLLIHPGMALATLTLIVAITFTFEGIAEVASYWPSAPSPDRATYQAWALLLADRALDLAELAHQLCVGDRNADRSQLDHQRLDATRGFSQSGRFYSVIVLVK